MPGSKPYPPLRGALDTHAKVVAAIRKRAKLSQEVFGKSIGCTTGMVSRVEKGTRFFSKKTVRIICKKYRVALPTFQTADYKTRARKNYPHVDMLGSNIAIGEGTLFGLNCVIDASRGNIVIGKNCTFGHNVLFLTADLLSDNAGNIELLDGVRLCSGCIVMPGVKIPAGMVYGTGEVIG